MVQYLSHVQRSSGKSHCAQWVGPCIRAAPKTLPEQGTPGQGEGQGRAPSPLPLLFDAPPNPLLPSSRPIPDYPTYQELDPVPTEKRCVYTSAIMLGKGVPDELATPLGHILSAAAPYWLFSLLAPLCHWRSNRCLAARRAAHREQFGGAPAGRPARPSCKPAISRQTGRPAVFFRTGWEGGRH